MGDRLQCAWIGVLEGRVADARSYVDEAELGACPTPYVSRIEKAAGESSQAIEYFEKAVAFPYRDQGGDGLLAYADLLRELGRTSDARQVYELVSERDPESSACAAALRAIDALPR